MKKIPARTRTRTNKILCGLDTYHQGIPMTQIAEILRDNGLVMLQEDGTEWAGLICGAEGQDSFELGDLNEIRNQHMVSDMEAPVYKPLENVLCLSWYKMASGRYEIVTYVS